jgi:putative oxidoreductase
MSHLTSMLASFDRFATSRRELGPGLLRLGLGAIFLAHSYAKLAIFTLPGTVSFFESHGLPGWTVYPVLTLELLGGLCLVSGVHVRLAALVLIPVMLGALLPHAANGWMFTNTGGGWEYVAFLLVALSAQVLLGRGSFARAAGRAGRPSNAVAAPL